MKKSIKILIFVFAFVLSQFVGMDIALAEGTLEHNPPQSPTWIDDTHTSLSFGSYPQSQVLHTDLTSDIINAQYDSVGNYQVGDYAPPVGNSTFLSISNPACDNVGDAIVNGVKYRRRYNEKEKEYSYFIYEPIVWRVLYNDNAQLLLMTDYLIDVQLYNTKIDTDAKWENATIRSWLNGYGSSFNLEGKDYSSGNFIDKAFTSEEQEIINMTDTVNNDNPWYNYDCGNDTKDKIFVLSLDDVTNGAYGFDDNKTCADDNIGTRGGMGTAYANNCCSYNGWWLRSKGNARRVAATVFNSGAINYAGDFVHNKFYIRPCLKIPLSAVVGEPINNMTRIEIEGLFNWRWDIDNLPALDTIKLNYNRGSMVGGHENVSIYVNGIYLKDVSDNTEYRGYTTTLEINGLNLHAGDSLLLISNCASGNMFFHYIEYGPEDISSDPNRNDGRKTDITDFPVIATATVDDKGYKSVGVRKDPSKRDLPVAKLHSGDKIQITQLYSDHYYCDHYIERDWHRIVYDGKKCYFPSNYCVIDYPKNLAKNKKATASSHEYQNKVEYGNDGSMDTRWCASNGNINNWWKVDLGDNYDIKGSKIKWESCNRVYKYKIETSSDNKHWILVVDKTHNKNANQTETDTFTAQSVRYVRITITGLEVGNWASFYEFEVFEKK